MVTAKAKGRTGLYPAFALRDVADRVNQRLDRTVLYQRVSDVLRGAVFPQRDLAEAIAGVVGVSLDQFYQDWGKEQRRWLKERQRKQQTQMHPPF